MAGKKPKLLKTVEGGQVYEGFIFKLKNVRLSYAHIAEPKAGTDDNGNPTKPSFSVTSIMPKDTHDGIKQELEKAFTQLKAQNKNIKIAKDKLCLRDGDDSDKDEYAGSWTVSAREKKRPKCRDVNAELIEGTDEIAEELYSGCYADVVIKLWLQDNSWGKRINANLSAVRKVRDGEPFGEGAVDDDDMYDDVDSGSGFDEDDDI